MNSGYLTTNSDVGATNARHTALHQYLYASETEFFFFFQYIGYWFYSRQFFMISAQFNRTRLNSVDICPFGLLIHPVQVIAISSLIDAIYKLKKKVTKTTERWLQLMRALVSVFFIALPLNDFQFFAVATGDTRQRPGWSEVWTLERVKKKVCSEDRSRVRMRTKNAFFNFDFFLFGFFIVAFCARTLSHALGAVIFAPPW